VNFLYCYLVVCLVSSSYFIFEVWRNDEWYNFSFLDLLIVAIIVFPFSWILVLLVIRDKLWGCPQ